MSCEEETRSVRWALGSAVHDNTMGFCVSCYCRRTTMTPRTDGRPRWCCGSRRLRTGGRWPADVGSWACEGRGLVRAAANGPHRDTAVATGNDATNPIKTNRLHAKSTGTHPPWYAKRLFFSAGLRIWNEHMSVSSTLIIAPARRGSGRVGTKGVWCGIACGGRARAPPLLHATVNGDETHPRCRTRYREKKRTGEDGGEV